MFYPQAVESKAGWLSGLMVPGLASFYTGSPSPLKGRPDNLPGPFTDTGQLLSGSFPTCLPTGMLRSFSHLLVCTQVGLGGPGPGSFSSSGWFQPLCSVHCRHYRPHGKTSQASPNSQLLADMSIKMRIS